MAIADERIWDHEHAGRYVEANGVRLFVREQGSGEPVLLVHGVPASSYLYRKMFAPLADAGLRAISFDFPGLGLSDKPKGLDYSWHGLAEWVGELVSRLGLDGIHLVVHDIGGPIALEWAISAHHRVRSITILNTLLDVEEFSPPFPMNLFRVPLLRHAAVHSTSVTVFHEIMKRRGVYDTSAMDRHDTAAYLELMSRRGGRRSFLAIMAGFDLSADHGRALRDGLLASGIPMQMVWGRHEVAIPPQQASYIETTFPMKHVRWVEGRHFIQEDAADEVSSHIAEFCRELS